MGDIQKPKKRQQLASDSSGTDEADIRAKYPRLHRAEEDIPKKEEKIDGLIEKNAEMARKINNMNEEISNVRLSLRGKYTLIDTLIVENDQLRDELQRKDEELREKDNLAAPTVAEIEQENEEIRNKETELEAKTEEIRVKGVKLQELNEEVDLLKSIIKTMGATQNSLMEALNW